MGTNFQIGTDAMFFRSPETKKSKEIQKILKTMVKERGAAVLHITAFGYQYDSAFWIAVKTDADRDALVADEVFNAKLNAVFQETGYLQLIEEIWNLKINNPELGCLRTPGIVFESQETVDRDFDGSWWYAMK
ncbi:hypothetical protein ACFSM5_07220 [Lacibacterium aquatile]|uniref:Uncharacterized protein n=1 Tax=Lacibacterium aquatile TaxID=1168082 RepID=A0ABW5DQD7_9PROT